MADKPNKRKPSAEERRTRLLEEIRAYQADLAAAALSAKTIPAILAALQRTHAEHAQRIDHAAHMYTVDLAAEMRAAGIPVDTRKQILTDTYVRLVTPLRHATDAINARLAHLADETHGKAVNTSDARLRIKREFTSAGIEGVTYRGGRRVRLETYAAMAARTEITETRALTEMAQAGELGYNYLWLPKARNGCPICGAKSERIYCIDPAKGNPLHAPPVYGEGGLYEHGYNCIHPNCRCTPVAYNPELDPDLRSKLNRTLRPSREDSRSDEDVRNYNALVADNRRRWQEQRQYDALRAKAAAAGTEPRWKTLGAYRRSYRGYIKTHGSARGFDTD